MNYTMKVCIITCMICMFAVALTMGGPIRRQASQLEKTVPIGGNVTLLCPLVANDLWKAVYWKKNGYTIYSLEVKSNIPMNTDTRYEVSNYATGLTIKDLKKTDGGIYYCKVATLGFNKERGHVLLSVTDQEEGLSTTIPPQPDDDSTDFYSKFSTFLIVEILVSILFITTIIIVTMHLFKKYRKRIQNLPARFVSAFRKKARKSTFTPLDPVSSHLEIGDEAPRSTSTPLGPDSSHHDITDEEGTRIYLPSSDTHGRDVVDVDDRLEESYC